MENDEILDPFCPYCETYKGIGPCKNENCIGNQSIEDEKQSSPSQGHKTSSVVSLCTICGENAKNQCFNCSSSYCSKHSDEIASMVFKGLTHRIGTCSICNKVICEHCWIVENQKIQCLEHKIERR